MKIILLIDLILVLSHEVLISFWGNYHVSKWYSGVMQVRWWLSLRELICWNCKPAYQLLKLLNEADLRAFTITFWWSNNLLWTWLMCKEINGLTRKRKNASIVSKLFWNGQQNKWWGHKNDWNPTLFLFRRNKCIGVQYKFSLLPKFSSYFCQSQ